MAIQCESYDRPAQPVLMIRKQAAVQNLPQVLGEAYGMLAQYLGEIGETPAGAPYVAYFNMDMQALDIEIGFPVGRVLPGRDVILAGEIPGGKIVTSLHIGPYSECGPAYQAMNEWIQVHGYEAAGPAYEFYLNDPQETPPAELKMQIVFPLKAKS